LYVWKCKYLGRFDAVALRWCILMRDPTDEALLRHEMLHIQQQRKWGFFRYMYKWLFQKEFRAKVEVEAYKLQGLSDMDIHLKLASDYNISLEHCKKITSSA